MNKQITIESIPGNKKELSCARACLNMITESTFTLNVIITYQLQVIVIIINRGHEFSI